MEIHIFGDAADRAMAHLEGHEELLPVLGESQELFTSDPTEVSATIRAFAATFCQVLAFGDNKSYLNGNFASKLERNSYLAEVNKDIFNLVLADEPQTLVIERVGRTKRIALGHLTGVAVVYPLNCTATKLYQQNMLGPHRFQKSHLVSDQSFRLADAVFLGGAIDLASVQDILSIPKLDFQNGKEPARLVHVIAKRTVGFLPSVAAVVSGPFGPTLQVAPEGKLPAVFTSFSGKGSGEHLARKLGFVQEPRIESEMGDRRYAVDLNLLNEKTTSIGIRRAILTAWAWFERTANPESSLEIVRSIRDAIAQLEYT